MKDDIQKLTQNEKYDLRRKQMKEEMEAGRKIQLDHLNEFITNPQDCESIYVEALKRGNKDLLAENQRLKLQLDREIKINRKMKSALEQYAYEGNWDCLFDDKVYGKDPNTNWNADGNGYDLAQQILKEIDNKE